jgi:LacI family transcriptional regulator
MSSIPSPPDESSGDHITIRDVAREAGLSLATVSRALRNSPGVKAGTLQRVREAAKKIGYRPDPLVATLMSRLRGRPVDKDVNVIALLNVGQSEQDFMLGTFYGDLVAGAAERARELGFIPELFPLRLPGMTPQRMGDILFHRGIHAVVILPMKPQTERLDLDWSHFAPVAVGYSLREPVLHRVVPDHYTGLRLALDRLVALGYRRIGLCVDAFTDERVFRKWTAAMAWHNVVVGRARAVPALVGPSIQRKNFLAWFRRHRPDAVIGQQQMIVTWIRESGLRVPEQVGYCHPSWSDSNKRCAAVDQQPFVVGRAAIEMVVGQIHRNERGIPQHPTILEVQPSWVEGSTISPLHR